MRHDAGHAAYATTQPTLFAVIRPDGPSFSILSSATGAAMGRQISKLGNPPVGSPRLSKEDIQTRTMWCSGPCLAHTTHTARVLLCRWSRWRGVKTSGITPRSCSLKFRERDQARLSAGLSTFQAPAARLRRKVLRRFIGGWSRRRRREAAGPESGLFGAFSAPPVSRSSSLGISRMDTSPKQQNWWQGPEG